MACGGSPGCDSHLGCQVRLVAAGCRCAAAAGCLAAGTPGAAGAAGAALTWCSTASGELSHSDSLVLLQCAATPASASMSSMARSSASSLACSRQVRGPGCQGQHCMRTPARAGAQALACAWECAWACAWAQVQPKAQAQARSPHLAQQLVRAGEDGAVLGQPLPRRRCVVQRRPPRLVQRLKRLAVQLAEAAVVGHQALACQLAAVQPRLQLVAQHLCGMRAGGGV
jgi:hypothetical protein